MYLSLCVTAALHERYALDGHRHHIFAEPSFTDTDTVLQVRQYEQVLPWRRGTIVVLMLGQRRRRWPNITATLVPLCVSSKNVGI